MTAALDNEDLHYVLSRLPKDVRDIMRSSPIFLGGGFIRSVISGEVPHDIDLFGETVGQLNHAAQTLAKGRNVTLHTTDNAHTILKPPRIAVQFIKRWLFSEPKLLLDSFDFTISQACVWWDPKHACWCSMVGERFYVDLSSKRLTYLSPERMEDAGGSMMRVRKFLSRGYKIQIGSLGAVIARLVSSIDFTTAGMDSEFAKTAAIVKLLVEVDPIDIIDGLELSHQHEMAGKEAEEIIF